MRIVWRKILVSYDDFAFKTISPSKFRRNYFPFFLVNLGKPQNGSGRNKKNERFVFLNADMHSCVARESTIAEHENKKQFLTCSRFVPKMDSFLCCCLCSPNFLTENISLLREQKRFTEYFPPLLFGCKLGRG